MSTANRTVLTYGAFLTSGTLIGALLVWTLTGAGEHGQGFGRGVLTTPNESFTLSGELSEVMYPGASTPLDLSIANSNDGPLAVSQLVVTVAAVTAPNATDSQPCSLADFDVNQVDDTFEFMVDAGATTTLSAYGLPSTAWPRVSMLEASSNQDGCKGASLTLAYTASGRVDE